MAKITKAEMPALAEQIVKCLGGKENVARINHCATRLRVNPVDMEKVDKDGLKRLHGVIGIDSSKAELQIIVVPSLRTCIWKWKRSPATAAALWQMTFPSGKSAPPRSSPTSCC